MRKEAALKVIFECADKFKINLVNKNLLFICTNSAARVTTFEVVFAAANFLHMTGVKFLKVPRIAPNQFYKLCIERRLKITDFDMSKDGTTDLKLKILPSLVSKDLSANMLGDYNGQRPVLYTEKLVGNVKGGIGFVFDSERKYFVPNTVLNDDIRCLINNKLRVIAAYRKSIDEPCYSELVYKSKKIDWTKITYPEEISYLYEML